MPVQEIIQLGNSYLWEHCSEVEEPSSAPIVSLVNDLQDTLNSFRAEQGFGQGIAAPQIGVLKRVIFLSMEPDGFKGALINPEITYTSPERYEMWDGCFCFPRLLARVSRASRVRVDYVDEAGNRQTIEADGELSSLLQHEIDHLDGVLAVERAVSPRGFISREEWERQGRPF